MESKQDLCQKDKFLIIHQFLILLKEWAEKNSTPILFLKLDFKKAFDRVNFVYLCETMELMGLEGSSSN
jgi:hypothetical protein